MDSYFDTSRKKFVAATPEEAVRQSVVSWLKDVVHVPDHLIETEFALRTFDPKNADRVDILVHDFREGANAKEPWLLVECKRPGVESPAALQVQVNKYLRVIKPKFIMLSLGGSAIFLGIDSSKKNYLRIPALPIYPPTNP